VPEIGKVLVARSGPLLRSQKRPEVLDDGFHEKPNARGRGPSSHRRRLVRSDEKNMRRASQTMSQYVMQCISIVVHTVLTKKERNAYWERLLDKLLHDAFLYTRIKMQSRKDMHVSHERAQRIIASERKKVSTKTPDKTRERLHSKENIRKGNDGRKTLKPTNKQPRWRLKRR
jgi:hypothetical protein